MDTSEKLRLFERYQSADFALLCVLESARKDYGDDYIPELLIAMQLHDSGQFPDDWFPESED